MEYLHQIPIFFKNLHSFHHQNIFYLNQGLCSLNSSLSCFLLVQPIAIRAISCLCLYLSVGFYRLVHIGTGSSGLQPLSNLWQPEISLQPACCPGIQKNDGMIEAATLRWLRSHMCFPESSFGSVSSHNPFWTVILASAFHVKYIMVTRGSRHWDSGIGGRCFVNWTGLYLNI